MGVFKWLFIASAVVGLGVAVIVLALAQTDGDSPARVEVDFTAIRDLANTASRDADSMERHADVMESVAATRLDHAHWASEAEIARANARTLRFVAEAARAIARDEATFPVTASAIQLDRLLGNGLNLQGLGRIVIEHAAAMERHMEDMRQQAAGDPSLLGAIGDLAQDARDMKAVGTAAVSHGKALEDKARIIARSIGVELN